MSLAHQRAGGDTPCIGCRDDSSQGTLGAVEHRHLPSAACQASHAPVLVQKPQECADPFSPDGRSWLVSACCAGRQHALLIGGDGVPLHHNGNAGQRAPARVERAAYRMVFGERAPELLAALDGARTPALAAAEREAR